MFSTRGLDELFQKLLKDLKELAEYDQSTSTNRHIFLYSDEGHSVQDKESLENPFNEITDNESDLEPEATTDTKLSSTEDIHPLAVQESPHDSDIHQLIEECSIEVPEEQKQKMEDTVFELVKIYQEKVFLCIHDDVDNLIESALDSKLLLINSNSQHLDKKEQEVKNVVEQPTERGNRSIQSLRNFKVVHKSSIYFKNISQISLIHSIEPIQSTKEPEHLLSMGYEHLSITPETEFDKVTESNAENLVPILNPHCFNVEYDFVESLLNRDTFIDFSSKFDFFGELAHIKPEIPKSNFDFEEEIHLIENLLYDNSFARLPQELNAEIADTIIECIPLLPIPVQDCNSQQDEIDIVTETDDVLPPSVENDDDLSNDS
nr:hypothetical protein [Tanacetum cinerariifolium]